MTDPPSGSKADPEDEPTVALDPNAPSSGAPSSAARRDVSPSGRRRIGPYTLIHKLGQGGMGEVWEAEQRKPLRRLVAVKIIKRGMDTAKVISRFEAERQALALMDHPAIARVFDAGETPEGRPYFVMELVRGSPIHQFCDQRRLGLRQRLELMIRVCDGVQHAHQKAILHRDLKPSNILITDKDGEAAPKIIDFGVAKATSQPLTEGTLYTELGQLIGTPEYMSPEQADPTGQDVDTRTDVYSLGVVLYQLLTGELPFRTETLRSAGYEGIRRILREEEPERPSTRVGKSRDTATTIAERRKLDVPNLVRRLTGDLDWIVLKALDKDRSRRYGSPTELAKDIRRYLDNQPVEARPASRAYRARKFIRRHRVGVGVASAFVVLLLVFAVAMGVLASQLRKQRDLANSEARTASAVSAFLAELFQASDPEANRGGDVTARELLDRGAERIASDLGDEPLVRARLEFEIGKVYHSLGLFAEAEPFLQRSLAARTELLGRGHPDTLTVMKELGLNHFRTDDYPRFGPLQAELVELSVEAFGENDHRTITAREGYALVLQNEGRLEEAMAQYLRALEGRNELESRGEGDPLEKAETLYNVGFAHYSLDQFEESVEAYRRALALDVEHVGAGARRTLTTKRSLAWSLLAVGDVQEAEELLEEVLVGRTELLGPEHDGTLMSIRDKVGILMRAGDYEEAERVARDLVATRRRVSGTNYGFTASALENHGSALFELGRLAEAHAAFSEAIDIETGLGRGTRRHVLRAQRDLIDIEVAQGELERAFDRTEEVLTVAGSQSAGNPIEGSLLTRRAEILLARSRARPEARDELAARAEADARRAVSLLADDDGPELGRARVVLADVLYTLGEAEAARAELTEGRALLAGRAEGITPRLERWLASREQRILGSASGVG